MNKKASSSPLRQLSQKEDLIFKYLSWFCGCYFNLQLSIKSFSEWYYKANFTLVGYLQEIVFKTICDLSLPWFLTVYLWPCQTQITCTELWKHTHFTNKWLDILWKSISFSSCKQSPLHNTHTACKNKIWSIKHCFCYTKKMCCTSHPVIYDGMCYWPFEILKSKFYLLYFV